MVLRAMALGLVPLGGMVLMKCVYYAFEDGRTVFWIQVPGTLRARRRVVAGHAGPPFPELWVVGIGLAMSLSNLVAVGLRTVGLRRTLHGLDGARILRLHVKAGLAALVSAVAGWGVLRAFVVLSGDPADGIYGLSWWQSVVVVAVGGTVMGLVYAGGLGKPMRVRELDQLAGPLVGRVRRLVRR